MAQHLDPDPYHDPNKVVAVDLDRVVIVDLDKAVIADPDKAVIADLDKAVIDVLRRDYYDHSRAVKPMNQESQRRWNEVVRNWLQQTE